MAWIFHQSSWSICFHLINNALDVWTRSRSKPARTSLTRDRTLTRIVEPCSSHIGKTWSKKRNTKVITPLTCSHNHRWSSRLKGVSRTQLFTMIALIRNSAKDAVSMEETLLIRTLWLSHPNWSTISMLFLSTPAPLSITLLLGLKKKINSLLCPVCEWAWTHPLRI